MTKDSNVGLQKKTKLSPKNSMRSTSITSENEEVIAEDSLEEYFIFLTCNNLRRQCHWIVIVLAVHKISVVNVQLVKLNPMKSMKYSGIASATIYQQ